ncbi:MAG: hypothetical protein KKA67_07230 [Spirochaetes bacterium]|nr:hypothetical protein [Spirochaetota bacterium]MBU1082036.1 hypothetical protein [Spirochaetota bacterium]
MEENAAYTNRLEQALLGKIERMDTQELKQLKDDFKLFQSAYQAIYNVLLRKGLIIEDPYKYELKISEVTTPSESPFAESDKIDQMCIRLSQFESYLDFLNNYYQFSVDFLTMGRIKRLAALTKYFAFTQFTENSPHTNTRYFAELVSQVRKGTDPLSAGIINEGLLQLEKTSRKIFQALKDLTLIHKERYKLELRRVAVDGMRLERDYVVTHQDDVIRKIRQRATEAAGDRPFYPELVAEVLAEDYGSDGENLKDEILKRLEVEEEKGKDKSTERNFKTVLLDGARVIIGVGFQLDDAIKKLEENQSLLESMDKSFMTKVKRALREMFGKKGEHVVHEVEYLDPVSSERRNESIDFSAFCFEAAKRAQSLVGMISKTSAPYKRMEGSSEDIIYKFLSKSIEELQAYHRKVSALDDFFLGAIEDPEFKGRVRNVKIELGALKNAIIKANQKKHEYIAQKEELEQMKRLGIRDA